MAALNYHYLRYFWTVAREGSLRKAAERLHVSQPTISAQVKALENQLGEKLTRRAGRGLALTEAGQRVRDYAEEIFALGEEMVRAVGREGARPVRVALGVTDALPKLVSHSLMRPVFRLPHPVQVSVTEASAAELLVQLAAHRIDLVLADEPAPGALGLRAFNHRLGDCGVSFLAAPVLAGKLRTRFPRSLDGAPMLLPTPGTALRRSIEQWLRAQGVTPRLVAEYDDAALMKIAGSDGLGVIPLPAVAERDACRRHGLACLGRARDCRQEFYAVSAERQPTDPVVLAITEGARVWLRGGRAGRRPARPR